VIRRVIMPVLVTVLVVATAACSQKNTNVVPPSPGVPASAKQIAGIYRAVSGSSLQLRESGDFFLLAGAGPVGGRFELRAGSFTVRGGSCGAQPGRYTVRVTGRPEPNKARLEFTVVDDSCADRRAPLVDQRWVYVES
jgi:hypothetical protein